MILKSRERTETVRTPFRMRSAVVLSEPLGVSRTYIRLCQRRAASVRRFNGVFVSEGGRKTLQSDSFRASAANGPVD